MHCHLAGDRISATCPLLAWNVWPILNACHWENSMTSLWGGIIAMAAPRPAAEQNLSHQQWHWLTECLRERKSQVNWAIVRQVTGRHKASFVILPPEGTLRHSSPAGALWVVERHWWGWCKAVSCEQTHISCVFWLVVFLYVIIFILFISHYLFYFFIFYSIFVYFLYFILI